VLGTLLITFGVANLLFGIASTAASLKMANIAAQVEGSGDAIEFGRALRRISGGYLSVGDDGTGAVAQDALKSLPAPWLAGVLGVLRIGLATAGVVLGAMLVRRRDGVLRLIVPWTGMCLILGLVGIWCVVLPTARLIGGVGGYVVVGLDASLHLVWPAIVLGRVRWAIRTGEGLQC